MKTIQVEAVYENGVLIPSGEIPLQDGQKVLVTVEPLSAADRMYGIVPWKGDPEELHRYLNDTDEGQWGGHDV